ncbi:MAG: FAD-dependent oxidoreductase [Glaciimonas sp.]|nr:FAD-dependent oxidoreductase [Glaciimonas sp.]
MRKRLLLVGGGHAHLFVLEALRLQRALWRERLEVTLLSRDVMTPYSGMLPGLIAGHYRSSECHVDLRPLAQSAGIDLVQASVDQIDLQRNVATAQGREWRFDLVSLDIGSSPPLALVPGATEHALGIKPIDVFLQQWHALEQASAALQRPIHIVMVGGGAGGVEMVLAMAHRLRTRRSLVKLSLVTRAALLPAYPRRAARLVMGHLEAAGVALLTGASVSLVTPGRLNFDNGSTASFDHLLWATGAVAQPWLAQSGVATVDGGFVQINQHLQSVSHPQLFAAGDIASNPQQSRPKAGVFAVRQGPILAQNLLHQVFGDALIEYRPQRDYLSLLTTGSRHAIACWYGLVWQGDWVWRWKDGIDRRFMRRFALPLQPADPLPEPGHDDRA